MAMTPTPLRLSDPRTARVVTYFETLTPGSLQKLSTVYSEDARFIDPFNDVTGIAGISQVFEHMFSTLDAPRFVVSTAVTEGDECFLVWDFVFHRKGKNAAPCRIHGASQLHFAPDGRVNHHRDHWDPAREIYETLPVLGSLMRWLRRQLSATQAH
jgi:ketosteroid isomerase-like protein